MCSWRTVLEGAKTNKLISPARTNIHTYLEHSLVIYVEKCIPIYSDVYVVHLTHSVGWMIFFSGGLTLTTVFENHKLIPIPR